MQVFINSPIVLVSVVGDKIGVIDLDGLLTGYARVGNKLKKN